MSSKNVKAKTNTETVMLFFFKHIQVCHRDTHHKLY